MARKVEQDRNMRDETGADPADRRRPHSIRFSDSEWQKIDDAALRHGVSAGEIVRTGALAAAEQRLAAPLPATVSPGHLALIETTFRMVYVLATLRRAEQLAAGRENELEELVAEAREIMAETMNETES